MRTGDIDKAKSCLFGALSLDIAFEELLSRKIEKATGLQASEFTNPILLAKETALAHWHRTVKNRFDPSTLLDGDEKYPIPGGRKVDIHR